MTGGEFYADIVERARGRGNYFKSTRINGSSFFDPRFRYLAKTSSKRISAEPLLIEGSPQRVIAGKGNLYFSEVPVGTLSGTSWPCRLFEIHPHGSIFRLSHDDPERRVLFAQSLTIVREHPAWMAFGPNGRAVVAFFSLFRGITQREFNAAFRAYKQQKQPTIFDSSHYAMLKASEETPRAGAANAAYTYARSIAVQNGWCESWRALPFLSNVLDALICADRITPADFDACYAPIASTIPLETVRRLGIGLYRFPSKA